MWTGLVLSTWPNYRRVLMALQCRCPHQISSSNRMGLLVPKAGYFTTCPLLPAHRVESLATAARWGYCTFNIPKKRSRGLFSSSSILQISRSEKGCQAHHGAAYSVTRVVWGVDLGQVTGMRLVVRVCSFPPHAASGPVLSWRSSAGTVRLALAVPEMNRKTKISL